MDQNSLQYIEQELVISKTINRLNNTTYSYLPNHKIKLSNGQIVCNTMSNNFLGFDYIYDKELNQQNICGNFYGGQDNSLYQLQNSLSEFLKTDETLILGSYEGFCAELMESILNTEDTIIYDSAVSTAIRRGIKSCQANKLRFPHGDINALEQHLKISQLSRLRIIVTDGIFYDSGLAADLRSIKQLAAQYNAIVIVDDSYGFLTTGHSGIGTDQLCGVTSFQDLKIVNMQNALCCKSGVFVSGNSSIIQLIKLRSRCYKYSVALSTSDTITATTVLNSIINDNSPLETLHSKANLLRQLLIKQGFNVSKPSAGIVSFVTDWSIDKLMNKLKELELWPQFSKIGKNTLVSFKVSTLCNF